MIDNNRRGRRVDAKYHQRSMARGGDPARDSAIGGGRGATSRYRVRGNVTCYVGYVMSAANCLSWDSDAREFSSSLATILQTPRRISPFYLTSKRTKPHGSCFRVFVSSLSVQQVSR